MERKEYIKQWKENNKEKTRQHWRKHYANTRLEALCVISANNLECVRCGFNEVEKLEINHKNGGGRKEFHKIGGYTIYRRIVTGKREITDLELLCRPCNMVHAAEMIGGKKYKVTRIK